MVSSTVLRFCCAAKVKSFPNTWFFFIIWENVQLFVGSRDILDLLRSFKVRPTVVIYDNAGHLVQHAERTHKETKLFGENGGMILPDTRENIEFARQCLAKGKLLRDKLKPGEYLVLYDEFHKYNSSSENSILRFTKLCGETANINTEVVEQLNSTLNWIPGPEWSRNFFCTA